MKKTRFIYLILSPTNPGADVFFSKSIKIEYEDSGLKDKIDQELQKLLDFCNHPILRYYCYVAILCY